MIRRSFKQQSGKQLSSTSSILILGFGQCRTKLITAYIKHFLDLITTLSPKIFSMHMAEATCSNFRSVVEDLVQ